MGGIDMGKGIPWTDEEKEIIIKFSLVKSKDEMKCLLPNRTWKAIRHMGLKLGLKLKDDYDPIPKNELFKIIDDVNHMKCKSCRRYLPANVVYYPRDNSCRLGFRSICKECKGENFGLAKSNNWTDEELEILSIHYPTRTNREIQKEFMPNRDVELINKKASSLGLHKTDETVLRAKRESYTEEWKQKISKTKKESGIHKGENNPMYGSHRIGSLNPNWQGGITELYEHLRRNLTQWKKDSMEQCGYKCILTGERFDDIHHLYGFQNIVDDTLRELNIRLEPNIGNYTDEELYMITDKCIEIHYRYPLGVCLKAEIHSLFHSLYTNRNNTPEQFYEFIDRWNNGEFKEVC
jgi:hypothetical protein